MNITLNLKAMKKILHLLISFTLLISCKSYYKDSNSTDLIIGTWTLSEFNNSGKDITLSDCKKKTDIIFEINNKFKSNSYVDFTNSTCVLEGITEANWRNVNNKKYEFFDSPSFSSFNITLLNKNMLIIEKNISLKNYSISTFIRKN